MQKNLVLLFFFIIAASISAQKTDIITLKNGDVITGEVKGMNYNILKLKTETAGTIQIEWNSVEQIQTPHKKFTIQLSDGSIIIGEFVKTQSNKTVGVKSDSSSFVRYLHFLTIVKIQQLFEGFWNRLEGDISAGFDFTKASNILNINLSGEIRHRLAKEETSLNFNSILTTKDKEKSADKHDITFSYRRLLQYRFFYSVNTKFEHNSELGLDLRTLVQGGFGKIISQTYMWNLSAFGGLTLTREWTKDGKKNNIESVFNAEYRKYIFTGDETSITASISVYPSITDWGRIRSNTDIKFSKKITGDFTFKLSFYHTYDSRPANNSSNFDYGIDLAVGYSI